MGVFRTTCGGLLVVGCCWFFLFASVEGSIDPFIPGYFNVTSLSFTVQQRCTCTQSTGSGYSCTEQCNSAPGSPPTFGQFTLVPYETTTIEPIQYQTGYVCGSLTFTVIFNAINTATLKVSSPTNACLSGDLSFDLKKELPITQFKNTVYVTLYQFSTCPDGSSFCGSSCCSSGTVCANPQEGSCCSVGTTLC